MPEETARKVFRAIKDMGFTPNLGPDKRTVFFSPSAKVLPDIIKAAAKISSERGHSYTHNQGEIGTHSITIRTRKAELRRRR